MSGLAVFLNHCQIREGDHLLEAQGSLSLILRSFLILSESAGVSGVNTREGLAGPRPEYNLLLRQLWSRIVKVVERQISSLSGIRQPTLHH